MAEIYDFRGSIPGDALVVETEKGVFAFAKQEEAAALRGWSLIQEVGNRAVEFMILDPPFRINGAVVRSGNELAIMYEDAPNRVQSLGEDPKVLKLAVTHDSIAV